jgi:hypothetical protein
MRCWDKIDCARVKTDTPHTQATRGSDLPGSGLTLDPHEGAPTVESLLNGFDIDFEHFGQIRGRLAFIFNQPRIGGHRGGFNAHGHGLVPAIINGAAFSLNRQFPLIPVRGFMGEPRAVVDLHITGAHTDRPEPHKKHHANDDGTQIMALFGFHGRGTTMIC